MSITTDIMQDVLSTSGLLHLLQLSSANLPVGAYSFSHGLEAAIYCQWVDTPENLECWLHDQLQYAMAELELPVLLRFYAAVRDENEAALMYWNAYILACRETAELRLSDNAMAGALQRLLTSLALEIKSFDESSYALIYSQAAYQWQVPVASAAAAYAWSWLENQIIAASKLMALGQSHAQQILTRLQCLIPGLVHRAKCIKDEDIGQSLPALAIASAWHETQYSRLFRS